MSKVLAVVEIADDDICRHSLPGITCAQQVAKARSAALEILVLGAQPQAAAERIAQAGYGASAVHVLAHPALDPFTAEAWGDAIAHAAGSVGATAVGGASSSSLREALPRAAAILDAPQASEITGVGDADTLTRPIAAGRALADVRLTGDVVFFTARGSEFAAAEPGPAATLSPLEPGSIDALGAVVEGVAKTKSSRPSLTEADVVVSGGRGMREAANFKLLEELTDMLGGALGASRAVTDAGMVPADLQVGQTGKIVAPNLYIAVAISGAIQHLAGIKGSKTIVAINKDAEAPIFEVADYGLVAKWEDTLPELVERVKAHKAGS